MIHVFLLLILLLGTVTAFTSHKTRFVDSVFIRSSSGNNNRDNIRSNSSSNDNNINAPPTPREFAEGSHDELMYCLGVNLARQLGDISPLTEGPEEMTNVARGILDTVIGRLSEEQQVKLLGERGKELNELIVARADNIRKKVEETGKAMLQQMMETEGARELSAGGVVVHVLEHGPDGPGEGMRPTTGSVVKVHYHGTLPDGTVFDSSIGKDPVQFPLANVIDGWKEGLLAMHEGEVAMLGIPPEFGYGPEGTPDGRIPGGATLFFKVELIEIVSGGIGGSGLVGVDGKSPLKKSSGSGLLGADGKPLG